MAGRSSSFQLNVQGDVHLTINHVEAREAGPALRSAQPKHIWSRPRAGSLVEIGGRWMLQVAAAVTSSAAGIELMSALGIG